MSASSEQRPAKRCKKSESILARMPYDMIECILDFEPHNIEEEPMVDKECRSCWRIFQCCDLNVEIGRYPESCFRCEDENDEPDPSDFVDESDPSDFVEER